MEVKNENKKIFLDLLKTVILPDFKYREVSEKIDLFFPPKDSFIYLDSFESRVFKRIFLDKECGEVLSKEFSTVKMIKFLKELSCAIK